MATSLSTLGEDGVSTDLSSLLKRYQECALSLVQSCQKLSDIPGAVKLERKCAADLKYLRSLSTRRGGFNITHLRSSNLGHYAGIIHSVGILPDVTHVLQAFSCPDRSDALHIDAVAYHGHAWIKVIARKAQAVHLTWAGHGQFGEKDITLQADDYIVCSKQHTVNFQVPKVVFSFYNGVTNDIADVLCRKGIVVLGERVSVDPQISRQLSSLESQDSDSDCSESSVESGSISSANGEGHCVDTSGDTSKQDSGENTTDTNTSTTTTTGASPSLQFTTCDCHICIEWRERHCRERNIAINEDGNSDTDSIHFTANKTKTSSTASSSIDYLDDICDRVSPFRKADTLFSSNDSKCLPNDSESNVCKFTTGNSHVSQSDHSNLVTSENLVNKSVDDISSVKQLHLETDFLTQSDKDLDRRTYKWNFGSPNVLRFIHNELLLHSKIDYNILRELRAANELNTIDNIHEVNLDVTTLISLVSAVSHGGCHYVFREKVLSEQAADERRSPVLPKLLTFLEGKALYACQTSIDGFNSIVELLGGKNERSRSKELLSLVTVIPDNSSFRTSTLPNTGKLKDRSKIIFGTGDSLGAVTTTANSGFIRAAERQGVTFSAFVHDARALTEMKEATAERIS